MMDRTAIVSDDQITLVAAAIPATKVKTLAREYLDVKEPDIENAPGRMPVTLSDVLHKGLETWTNRHEGGRTVEDAKRLLQRAKDDGVEVVGVLKALQGHAHEDVLSTATLSQMSRHFTKDTWTTFSQRYLHLSQSEIESQLPIQDNDLLHHTTVSILTKWRTNNGSTATVQHLIDVLHRAVTGGCIGHEVIQAFYEAQAGLSIPSTTYSSVVSKLCTLYQTDQYSKMSPLHWDKHAPAYSIRDMYVPMDCQPQINHPFASSRAKLDKEASTISLSSILLQVSPSASDQRRILIEGLPGSGKTTLCKKLAYDWSCGVEEVKGLLAYHCVFVIRLSLLKADQSIADYISTELLNEPNSKYIVQSLLTKSICLIILDGYDELRFENRQLNDLIDGSEYACAHVLLTSRPEAVSNIKNTLQLLYKMKDLTDGQVVQFAQMHDTDQSPMFNEDNIWYHPLRSFVSTPLYLSWIMMLCDKLSDAQVRNLSDLYKVIVEAIFKKAVQRISNRPRQCRNAFVGLCNTAYRAMCADIMDLDGSIYNMTSTQQKLGFTNTYYKQHGLEFIKYHNFNHKTLLEYLTAKHIVHTTSTSTSNIAAAAAAATADSHTNSVVGMLLSVAEISDTKRRVSSQVVQFVLGLLAADNRCGDIQAVLRSVVMPAVQIRENGAHSTNSHYGLLCVAQCSSCTDLHITDNRLVGSMVTLLGDCIRTDCTEGLIVYLKRGGSGMEKINIDSKVITTNNAHTLTTAAVPEIRVLVHSDRELVRMYSDGGVMVGVETVCHLWIKSMQQIQSAFTNILRQAWRCSEVTVRVIYLFHLMIAWRCCSQEERVRVRWKRLELLYCSGGEEELKEVRQLLPDAVEIVHRKVWII